MPTIVWAFVVYTYKNNFLGKQYFPNMLLAAFGKSLTDRTRHTYITRPDIKRVWPS